MRIGFVGLGSMGAPVARNLLAAGHDLVVHDLRRGAVSRLLERGAQWAGSPADLAARVDVVFLSVPSHTEVEQVCFGEKGLFTTVRAGTYLIDLTTGSVEALAGLVEAARECGVRYLTCPVSQGVDNAAIGKLSIFVGGEREDYEACLPLLATIASVVIPTGAHEGAMAAKLLTNLLWFAHVVALREALVLGAKAGIDLRVLGEVIRNSCGTSWVAEHDLPSIYDGGFDPTFTTRLCTKDLRLIAELATGLGVPLELGKLVEATFARAQARYGGDSPELSVVRELQERTDTVLQVGPVENDPEAARA